MTAEADPLDPSALSPTGRWEAVVGGIRLRFGAGRLAEVGEAARELAHGRALLVTDPGLVAAGHAAVAERALRQAGFEVAVFSEVAANPTTEHVEAGTARASTTPPDVVVAVGGGSAMDCAKGINFLLTNGGRLEDYWGSGRATRPMLPAVGVPTTAGTGSDAQSYALISDPRTHRKMACGDPKARFRTVVLDPALVATAPRPVAATAGLDALSHAVESHVSTRSGPASRRLSRQAWRLLTASLERHLEGKADHDAAGAVLLGAHLAGAAIELSMLGAAHACANPLTARFGVVHGAAVALMLPHVVRFNAETARQGYQELADGPEIPTNPGAALAERIVQLRAAAELPGRLADVGVTRDVLPELARLATQEWTGKFNPRPIGESELLKIYEAAY